MPIMNEMPAFEWVDIHKITLGIYQPRQSFDTTKIQELAQSIAQYGILQPLLVRSDYQLIAGERRWRAAQMVGLRVLPCMILPVQNAEHALLSILENIQREQIEPLEEALSYQRLQQEFYWTQEHIARLLGKSRTHVTNMLRLLKLGKEVIAALEAKKITYGHARVLVGLTAMQQDFYLNAIIEQRLSVRHLEKKVAKEKKKPSEVSADLIHFTRTLSEQVGTHVEYETSKNGAGWLKFKFFNQESLEGLLEKLGLSYDE